MQKNIKAELQEIEHCVEKLQTPEQTQDEKQLAETLMKVKKEMVRLERMLEEERAYEEEGDDGGVRFD